MLFNKRNYTLSRRYSRFSVIKVQVIIKIFINFQQYNVISKIYVVFNNINYMSLFNHAKCFLK